MKDGYQYENRPRNVFRFGLAVWRVLKDPENTQEAAIVEREYPLRDTCPKHSLLQAP